MTIEAALIKPVVDALLDLFRQGERLRLKHDAEAALREAIRELLLANPDENRAAARIAIARAAGILSEDIVLAENMLEKHRATRARGSARPFAGSRRRATDEPRVEPAGKPARTGRAAKSTNAKDAARTVDAPAVNTPAVNTSVADAAKPGRTGRRSPSH